LHRDAPDIRPYRISGRLDIQPGQYPVHIYHDYQYLGTFKAVVLQNLSIPMTSVPDPHWIGIQLASWIRIQETKISQN
jgi:hypothetical protein